MSTPRKKWFKVADSVLYEGWDDNQLATMIRLGAYLNTRWAREGRTAEEACRARLDSTDLAKITAKRRRDVALKSLQRLANVTGMSLRIDGDFTEIIWPKWSEFQYSRTRETPESGPKNAPSADARRKTQDARKKTAPPAPSSPREEKASEKPEAIARREWPALRERAAKHGARWAERPGRNQVAAIAARLRDGATSEDLFRAIEGHVRRNSFEGGDPVAYLSATTIYRPSKFDANVEASHAPPPKPSGSSTPPAWCDCTRTPKPSELDAARCDGCGRAIRANRLKRFRAEHAHVAEVIDIGLKGSG